MHAKKVAAKFSGGTLIPPARLSLYGAALKEG
jgi:hypothetical protein